MTALLFIGGIGLALVAYSIARDVRRYREEERAWRRDEQRCGMLLELGDRARDREDREVAWLERLWALPTRDPRRIT